MSAPAVTTEPGAAGNPSGATSTPSTAAGNPSTAAPSRPGEPGVRGSAPAQTAHPRTPGASGDTWYGGRRGTPHRALGALLTAASTLAVASALCLIVFYAKGGPEPLNPARMTTLEMVLTLAGGATVAVVMTLTPSSARPFWGVWPALLLLAFAALCALSVVWSVQPDESWQDAAQMLAYSALFAAAVALVRAAPGGWSALLGGVLLAAVVVCTYALLTKVLPADLDANDPYARLRAPYEYWNAIGLTAAMGVVACLWLGARRTGHALFSALAYPAMGLLLVTVLLAYSRGSLVAVAVGVALWLCLTPLRLRGAAVLLSGGFGALLVVAWDFSQPALTSEKVALSQRVHAGDQLGVVLAAMLLALTAAGVAIGFFTGRRAPRPKLRRRMGAVMLSLPVIALLAFFGLLVHSQRGLTGSISHGVSSLTNPNAPVPVNTPGRLTAVGSVRARYWNEALEVFSEHPALGAGADGYATARLRHRTETLNVTHAHGFVVQTLADLGLVGLALVLALLIAWLVAAGRATHPFNRRWQNWRWRQIQAPYTPERVGLLTMLCIVFAFGVHSLVDWTWYIPGDACVALLCAGWLAGRGEIKEKLPLALQEGLGMHAGLALSGHLASQGELAAPAAGQPVPATAVSPQATAVASQASRRERRKAASPRSLVLAAAIVVLALLAAWAQWQPLRSFDASNDALALLGSNHPQAARAAAQLAVSRDPLSVQALSTLATIQQDNGESVQARATLQRAVRLQPSNPQTWKALGIYDLQVHNPKSALNELRAAIYLDPEAIAPEATIMYFPELVEVRNAYLLALRETGSA